MAFLSVTSVIQVKEEDEDADRVSESSSGLASFTFLNCKPSHILFSILIDFKMTNFPSTQVYLPKVLNPDASVESSDECSPSHSYGTTDISPHFIGTKENSPYSDIQQQSSGNSRWSGENGYSLVQELEVSVDMEGGLTEKNCTHIFSCTPRDQRNN